MYLFFCKIFSVFNLDRSSNNLPTIFTSLAGTGFLSIDAGVGTPISPALISKVAVSSNG